MRNRYLLAALVVAALAGLGSLPSPAEEAPRKEKLDKLIAQMGSGSFKEREDASKELAAIGVPALEALRKAAKGDDAEVRKRAGELLPKIEAQAESLRVLVPKRVHLVFKDTPVPEAVADLRKKSGYRIYLHDPQEKLKERKITLDTGETSFWHAVTLLGDKAELTEATMQDLMGQPQQFRGAQMPPMPPPPPIRKLPPAEKKAPAPQDKNAPPPDAKPAPAQPAPPAPPAAQPPPGGLMQQQIQIQRQMQMQAANVRIGQGFMPGMKGMYGQLMLKDGKPKKVPTDDRNAIRIRALVPSDQLGNVAQDEIMLPLELALEAKLQWQGFQSIRLERAVDDRDQQVAQVLPQMEGAPGLGGPGGQLVAQQMAMRMMAQQMAMQNQVLNRMGGGVNQQVFLQLKKGAKEAKSLKELKGFVTIQLLTESQPLISTDDLAKSAGKTFKGKEGGSIKILEVKTDEDKKTTIQLELEQPPNSIPAMAQMGFPAMNPPMPVPAPLLPQPAPAPAKGAGVPARRILQGGGNPLMTTEPLNGLSVQDDKGNALPIEMRAQQLRIQRNAVVPVAVWTLVCQPGKDQGQPAKLVYLGRKRTTVDVPFALKDVPLP